MRPAGILLLDSVATSVTAEIVRGRTEAYGPNTRELPGTLGWVAVNQGGSERYEAARNTVCALRVATSSEERLCWGRDEKWKVKHTRTF